MRMFGIYIWCVLCPFLQKNKEVSHIGLFSLCLSCRSVPAHFAMRAQCSHVRLTFSRLEFERSYGSTTWISFYIFIVFLANVSSRFFMREHENLFIFYDINCYIDACTYSAYYACSTCDNRSFSRGRSTRIWIFIILY